MWAVMVSEFTVLDGCEGFNTRVWHAFDKVPLLKMAASWARTCGSLKWGRTAGDDASCQAAARRTPRLSS